MEVCYVVVNCISPGLVKNKTAKHTGVSAAKVLTLVRIVVANILFVRACSKHVTRLVT